MKIGINCGHTISGSGSGAVGLIKESEHTRLVGYSLMEKLRGAGVDVTDCTIDQAKTQQEYLSKVVEVANGEDLDWFISIHFNASASHSGHGVEVYTYKGRQYQEALNICTNLEKLGFTNRGVKEGSSLYVIRKTKAKAMLVEVCFCDNQEDVETYICMDGEKAVAQAIYNAIYTYEADASIETEEDRTKSFIDVVGEIAQKDWKERRIVLPSVVVAQAIKESARGTSELAREANALFGIKKNGWTGRTYMKTATEQRKDGSYYSVPQTEWRAYDSWEQSVIDHNDYIATRSTDGGKTLRYAPVIGCDDYTQACLYLQQCGYATALNYAESLIKDYIETYGLQRLDV